MHPLDHLEDFTDDWISHLQEPDPISPDYSGPRCPFAKKARDEKRLSFRKVYDYFSAYDFWEVVSEECDKFDGSKDVVIVAAPVSYTHLRAHETSQDLVCRLLLEKKKANNHN